MTVEQVRPYVALAGMGIALLGVALDHATVVWVAIGVLGIAFLLRFVPRLPPPGPPGN